MEQRDCSTKRRKYTHLGEKDRYRIEVYLEGKKTVWEISIILGRARTTIYREIKRGTISRIQSELTEKRQYRANVAQADYERVGRNKERGLKIGKDRRLEEYIRRKLIEDKYSPDAIIGEIKARGQRFRGLICTKTLYNYIEWDIFSGISNKNLWEKRKRKKQRYRTVIRESSRNRLSRSIEERPEGANNRIEYGHWEGDTVKGVQGTKVGLFTLSERKTREEIILKVGQSNQEAIQAALDGLEKDYGDKFRSKFKSITFDNGSEFLGWESLELSMRNPSERRTTIYFAHPYSSWERGTNENQNRMIRRFIPKGTDIAAVSEERVKEIQDWMNNYPRKILGYKTAKQMSQSCSQSNSDLKPKNVAL